MNRQQPTCQPQNPATNTAFPNYSCAASGRCRSRSAGSTLAKGLAGAGCRGVGAITRARSAQIALHDHRVFLAHGRARIETFAKDLDSSSTERVRTGRARRTPRRRWTSTRTSLNPPTTATAMVRSRPPSTAPRSRGAGTDLEWLLADGRGRLRVRAPRRAYARAATTRSFWFATAPPAGPHGAG
jgi:hypothetical protein